VLPFDSLELRCFPPGRNEPAGPGIVAAVQKIADRAKQNRRISPLTVRRPDVTLSPDAPVQRLLIPTAGDLQIPAFFIRGNGRGVLLALDDRGKELVLKEGRVATALKDGWSICGVDPRGIGEMATTQTGWLSAVSLLLGSSFVDRQALDLWPRPPLSRQADRTAGARAQRRPRCCPGSASFSRLESYALYEGFQSYRDFLNRPKSLEISISCARTIATGSPRSRDPVLLRTLERVAGPDITDLLKTTKARGTRQAVMNGDRWETRGP
jgi:hypothetical protein